MSGNGSEDRKIKRSAAYARRTPALWIWAILMIAAANEIFFDPFGFSRVTERYAQDISNLIIFGPLYPEAGRENISVALLDEPGLAALGEPWPWRYEMHARVLESLLAYGPRAVGVDVLFVDERDDPTIAALMRTVERYARAGVPLYMIADSHPPEGRPALRPDLWAAGPRLVDAAIELENGVARRYPRDGACFGSDPARAPEAGCRSFAATLYEDIFRGAIAMPHEESHFELIWGIGAHPVNLQWMHVAGPGGAALPCQPDTGWFDRVAIGFSDIEAVRTRCPYQGVVPVEALLAGTEDEDIAALVAGRVVFYGISLEGLSDAVYTPTHGRQPGVFVHAMALDNLISFEGTPKVSSVEIGGVTFEKDDTELVVAGVLLMILTLLRLETVRITATGEEQTPNWGMGGLVYGLAKRLVLYMIVLLTLSASGAILYFAFNISAGNWVELFFIAAALIELLERPVLFMAWGNVRSFAERVFGV